MEYRLSPGGRSPTVKRNTGGATATISGYASVFYDSRNKDTQFSLWEGAVERILPGAFDRALRERDDVRGLFNHDGTYILGRTANRTMRLSVDRVGLRYEIDIDTRSQRAMDVVYAVERGDVSGSSFAFRVDDERWFREGDLDVREVAAVHLFDVGPVTYPAYKAASSTADVDELEPARKFQPLPDSVWSQHFQRQRTSTGRTTPRLNLALKRLQLEESL